MFNIFTGKNKKFPIISNNFINNLLNNLSNTKSNKMDAENKMLIIPGHYQEKSSINTDSPIIIRVLGADLKREDSWIIENGKTIPSYIIEQNYVPLNTVPTLEMIKKQPPKSIFAGLDQQNKFTTTDDVNEILDDDFEDIDSNILPETLKIKVTPHTKTAKELSNETFMLSIFSKQTIDTINRNSLNELGVEKYKSQQFMVSFELNYLIDKCKQTSELLELDKREVAEFLYSTLNKETIKNRIINKIHKLLLEDKDVNNEVNKDVNEVDNFLVQESNKDFKDVFNGRNIIEIMREYNKLENDRVFNEIKETQELIINHLNNERIKISELKEKEIIEVPKNPDIIDQKISEIDNYLKTLL